MSLIKSYEFTVGVHEQHVVRIAKHRELLLAFLRAQPVYAYVDNRLVAQGVV